MGQIAKRIEDKRLLELLRAFLNARVMENQRGRNSVRRFALTTAVNNEVRHLSDLLSVAFPRIRPQKIRPERPDLLSPRLTLHPTHI
jgi:hypothetical protein